MIETLLARLRLAISSATPLLSLLFLTFLTAMPISLPASIQFTPAWVMMGLVFWSINNPELLPIWGIFLVGLLRDGLDGGVIGIYPLILIATYEIILVQRRVLLARSFISAWVAFCLCFLVASLGEWVVFIMADRAVSFYLLAKHYVLSVALFPFVTYVLSKMLRFIVIPPTITIELGGRTR